LLHLEPVLFGLFEESVDIDIIHEHIPDHRSLPREAPRTLDAPLQHHQQQVGDERDPDLYLDGLTSWAKSRGKDSRSEIRAKSSSLELCLMSKNRAEPPSHHTVAGLRLVSLSLFAPVADHAHIECHPRSVLREEWRGMTIGE